MSKRPAAAKQPAIAAFGYKRRPGPEQVKLRVEIDVPGNWFKNLTPAQRKEKYRATAVDYEEWHVFEAASRGRSAKVSGAIGFICASDAAAEEAPAPIASCCVGVTFTSRPSCIAKW